MHSKAGLFNLALNALLLSRRVVNADTDTTNEAKVLQTNYDIAVVGTLQDLDLDSTATDITLELVNDDQTRELRYAYKYPTTCAFLRRIKRDALSVDRMERENRETHIPKLIRMFNRQKVIFTAQQAAVAEIIMADFPVTMLDIAGGLAIAYRLASLSAPLIVGKGAAELIKKIDEKYLIAKAEAQEQDSRENFNFTSPAIESEFVLARTR